MFRNLLWGVVFTSSIFAEDSLIVFEKKECLSDNRVITEKHREEKAECETYNEMFEKYEEVVGSINESNKENIEIPETEIKKHPLIALREHEAALENEKNEDIIKQTTTKINSLKSIHRFIRPFPIEYDKEEAAKTEAEISGRTKEELVMTLKEEKAKYEDLKELKLRKNSNQSYTRLVVLQKQIPKEDVGGIDKVKDYQELKNEIWEKYREKYNDYIIKKNTFNIRRANMAYDNYSLFYEHDANQKRYQELSKEITDPEDRRYLEAKYRADTLSAFINKIKLYPIPRINYRSAKSQNRIKATLNKNFSYTELVYYMNREEAIMNKYKKYRNQYRMELHYFRWAIYDYIITKRLFRR